MASRAGRLLAILEDLRLRKFPVSAAALAEAHGVSERTIYRDIASLREEGADIGGDPGVGYVLRPGFVLPPMNFKEEELEALALGLRWVALQGDGELADAADNSFKRICQTLPGPLRLAVETCGLLVPRWAERVQEPWQASLRQAIRNEHIVDLHYRDAENKETERRIWPFVMAFFAQCRVVAAWCELRQDFRCFRADRVISLRNTQKRYPRRRHELMQRWRRICEQEGPQTPS